MRVHTFQARVLSQKNNMGFDWSSHPLSFLFAGLWMLFTLLGVVIGFFHEKDILFVVIGFFICSSQLLELIGLMFLGSYVNMELLSRLTLFMCGACLMITGRQLERRLKTLGS